MSRKKLTPAAAAPPERLVEISPARHFETLPRAHHYARQLARVTQQRYYVCLRLNRWYVLDPPRAKSARGNPNWPGINMNREATP